jgi:hypothetical protein
MALKYGDAVVLLQKRPDGTVSRVNAIVLDSIVHTPRTADRKVIEGAPAEEHLDVMFPRELPDGHTPKTREPGAIFQPAYDVRAWRDDLYIGWQWSPGNMPKPAAKAKAEPKTDPAA